MTKEKTEATSENGVNPTTSEIKEQTMIEKILEAEKERNARIERVTGTRVEVDMDFSPTGCSPKRTAAYEAERSYQIAHTDLPSGAGYNRTWVTTEKQPNTRTINGAWLDRENLDLSPFTNALIDKVLEMEEEDVCPPHVATLLCDALLNLAEGKRVMIPNLVHSSVAAEILGLPSSKALSFAEMPELLCDRYVMGKDVFYLNRDIYNVADHLAHTRNEEHYCPICKKMGEPTVD